MLPSARSLAVWWALVLPMLASAAAPERVEFPALKPFNGESVTLSGWLYRPESEGSFPALVLLHGCGGLYNSQGMVTPSYRYWAEMLRGEGYVALLVDSFGPRGERSICTQLKRSILEGRERVEDAYAALQWLSQRGEVRADRIGLIGWSNGASGTLNSMRADRKQGQGFRSAVAFYPGCRLQASAKTAYQPYAPLLILIGEADDWTASAPCVETAKRAQAAGAPLAIVTYPGAYHSFDRLDLPLRYLPNVRNFNKPANCCGATVGEHAQAREDAIKRTLEFFSRTLKN
jgi:dienelactone hydrolase